MYPHLPLQHVIGHVVGVEKAREAAEQVPQGEVLWPLPSCLRWHRLVSVVGRTSGTLASRPVTLHRRQGEKHQGLCHMSVNCLTVSQLGGQRRKIRGDNATLMKLSCPLKRSRDPALAPHPGL